MKLFAMAMLVFAFYSTASQAGVTSFTVTSATLSKSTGTIAVTGTIACTAGDLFSIVTNIVQVSGGHNGETIGLPIMGTCSGGVDTWVAPQTLRFGSIKNGNAQVVAEAMDLTDGFVVQEVFHQSVTPIP